MTMRTRTSWMLGLLAAAILLASAWTVQAQGMLTSGAYQDAEMLTEQAVQAYDKETPVRVVLKASGPYRSYTEKAKLLGYGQELGGLLGMPKEEYELREQQGETVYRQELETADGCTKTLLLTWWEDAQTFVIVKKECTITAAELSKLPVWQQELEHELQTKAQWQPVWNVMVQGELSRQLQRAEAEDVLGRIAAPLAAVEAERYEDRGTVSVSYTSSKLKHSVKSGKKEIHLQVGLHTDSKDGSKRLTLGTPMITTEY